jgi:hypothetical protein
MTFTPNKNIETPSHGSDVNTWDVNANANFTLIDTCFSGTLLLNATGLSGSQALTQTQVQPPFIQISGTPTAAITYTVPASIGGTWTVRNTTAGGFAVGISSLAGGSTVNIPANSQVQIVCDGSVTGMVATTTITFPGTSSQITYLLSDVNLGVLNSVHDIVNTGSIGASGQAWEITACATMQCGIQQAFLEVDIFNGSVYLAAALVVNPGAAQTVQGQVSWIGTLSGPTTFTMRCVDRTVGGNASSVTASSLGAPGVSINLGNTSTWIKAVRLA